MTDHKFAITMYSDDEQIVDIVKVSEYSDICSLVTKELKSKPNVIKLEFSVGEPTVMDTHTKQYNWSSPIKYNINIYDINKAIKEFSKMVIDNMCKFIC